MLRKAERLTRAEFTEFFKRGQRSNSPHLQLIYTPYKSLHGSVVVSKKVAKKAHDRNALRRRVYDQVRRELHGKCTGVFILLLRPSFASLSKIEQRESVQKMLARITMSSTR